MKKSVATAVCVGAVLLTDPASALLPPPPPPLPPPLGLPPPPLPFPLLQHHDQGSHFATFQIAQPPTLFAPPAPPGGIPPPPGAPFNVPAAITNPSSLFGPTPPGGPVNPANPVNPSPDPDVLNPVVIATGPSNPPAPSPLNPVPPPTPPPGLNPPSAPPAPINPGFPPPGQPPRPFGVLHNHNGNHQQHHMATMGCNANANNGFSTFGCNHNNIATTFNHHHPQNTPPPSTFGTFTQQQQQNFNIFGSPHHQQHQHFNTFGSHNHHIATTFHNHDLNHHQHMATTLQRHSRPRINPDQHQQQIFSVNHPHSTTTTFAHQPTTVQHPHRATTLALQHQHNSATTFTTAHHPNTSVPQHTPPHVNSVALSLQQGSHVPATTFGTFSAHHQPHQHQGQTGQPIAFNTFFVPPTHQQFNTFTSPQVFPGNNGQFGQFNTFRTPMLLHPSNDGNINPTPTPLIQTHPGFGHPNGQLEPSFVHPIGPNTPNIAHNGIDMATLHLNHGINSFNTFDAAARQAFLTEMNRRALQEDPVNVTHLAVDPLPPPSSSLLSSNSEILIKPTVGDRRRPKFDNKDSPSPNIDGSITVNAGNFIRDLGPRDTNDHTDDENFQKNLIKFGNNNNNNNPTIQVHDSSFLPIDRDGNIRFRPASNNNNNNRRGGDRVVPLPNEHDDIGLYVHEDDEVYALSHDYELNPDIYTHYRPVYNPDDSQEGINGVPGRHTTDTRPRHPNRPPRNTTNSSSSTATHHIISTNQDEDSVNTISIPFNQPTPTPLVNAVGNTVTTLQFGPPGPPPPPGLGGLGGPQIGGIGGGGPGGIGGIGGLGGIGQIGPQLAAIPGQFLGGGGPQIGNIGGIGGQQGGIIVGQPQQGGGIPQNQGGQNNLLNNLFNTAGPLLEATGLINNNGVPNAPAGLPQLPPLPGLTQRGGVGTSNVQHQGETIALPPL